MWPGFAEYAGVEVINAARTETYVKAAGVGWFKPVYVTADFAAIMGEHYDSPRQDDAPWCDPDNADSYDFWGVYPLDVSGIEDATTAASLTESTQDGGLVGRTRFGTRAVVFNVLLLGATECAVMYGMDWLKAALLAEPCAGQGRSCQGSYLCFFRCNPCLEASCDGPELCQRYRRSLHRVAVTTGPNVTGKQTLTDGCVAWMVTWTMVAGNPYKYGEEVPFVEGFMRRKNPYVAEMPDGTPPVDDAGQVFTESDCEVETFQPIQDPECPQQTLPPDVPQNTAIALACFNPDANYRRRSFVIPAEFVPLWGDIVPYIEIHANKGTVRNLRLRFYTDVLADNDPNRDPCSYCGDIVFSYIPQGSTLVFDGTDEAVYVQETNGVRRRADSVVFGSDGGPFEWPQLTCGYQYICTWDLPQSQSSTLPSVDMSLFTRTV